MDDLGLSPTQKAQLQTVADLLLDIYRTLARMRYLDPEWIQPGPHDIEHLLPTCRELKLDPSIIYLYSILPYINPAITNWVDFFGGSYFADFRTKGDVEDSRDPFFMDESDQVMRPWMTPLSRLGNHQSCIIYSAKKHRIWIVDQEIWDTTDPKLSGGFDSESDDSDIDIDIDSRVDGSSDQVISAASEEGGAERGGEGDSSEQTVYNDEKTTPAEESEGDYDNIPSRPAEEVLRDINRWYHELKVMPGGGENTGTEWMSKIARPLYFKHGWPRGDFDGDAFLRDSVRVDAARSAKRSVKDKLGEKDKFSGWLEESYSPAHLRVRESLTSATTVDEKWLARWKLWDWEMNNVRTQERVREAEAEANQLFPDGVGQRPEDMPLWELEQLRHWSKEKQEGLECMRREAEEIERSDPDRAATFQIELRFQANQVMIHQRAYEAARADAERLCPGRSAASVPGIQCLGREENAETVQQKIRDYAGYIEKSQREVKAIRQWTAQLPSGADQARNMANKEIQMHEGWIESNKEVQAELEQESRGST